MLAQEALGGGCLTAGVGPRVLAGRKRNRGTASTPGVRQSNLDSFLESSISSETDVAVQRAEQEWQRTIGSMLRHDLLNKLMVAKGGLELFDRSGETKFLDMVRRNLETCGEIVGRISLLENPNGLAKLTPTDVASVAKRVISGHQERGIGLEVQGKGWVMADSTFYHVLDNLVSNAIKHGSPSNIRIDIEEKGSAVLVKVTDDGVGIPLEARGGLFQEGFKYGPKGNTGLGLFIVRRLVQRYGGNIWLDENAVHATTFCIELTNVNC
jgi:signal transduction histidine kinase